MNDEAKSSWETFTEEVEVAGQHLVSEVNRLLADQGADPVDWRLPAYDDVPAR